MIFSFFDFIMKIVSYKAIITGKGVGHIYDSDKKKYFMKRNQINERIAKICKMENKFPYA